MQPSPPNPPRLILREADGKQVPYFGLVAFLGVASTKQAGASIDATLQYITTPELAMLGDREKNYRLRVRPASDVDGLHLPPGSKPVVVVYFEPLATANVAYQMQSRSMGPNRHPCEVAVLSEYQSKTLANVQPLSDAAAARGHLWDPTTDLIDGARCSLTPELVAKLERSDMSDEARQYMRTVCTLEGQLAYAMQTPLRSYLDAAVIDMSQLGIPLSAELERESSLSGLALLRVGGIIDRAMAGGPRELCLC